MTNAEENKIDSKQEAIQVEAAPEQEMTMDQLFAEQEELVNKLNKREIVQVTVVQVGKDSVLVDTGDKKEGYIPLSDFEGKAVPEAGEKVSAVLVKKGSDERHAVLSFKKAQEYLGWEIAKKAFDNKERVRGTIVSCVKGGYIVDVFGVSGFMPLSLSELHTAYKHYLPAGAKVKCVVVEFSKEKNKLIVSRKQVLEEDEAVRRDGVLAQVKEGEVLRVVVAKADKDKLYLRFHGIEGVVTLDNVAWQDTEKAITSFRRGQRLKAKLLKIDKETGKLEFGLKQLFLNPADALRRKFPYKSTTKGKIVAITEEGVEVSLGKNNTKGFISQFEMGRDFDGNVDDVINVMVIGINPDDCSVNLSVKKYDQVQNKKFVAQYMKQAPRPTLGQLLQDSLEESENK
ncbi:Ribosomal protein S1 [Elusimicrobium minutum Pei191]|uniref:Ribosomal protein S1 n=1 Tax=Elusimicrobium minutum (strain Pei191) TaxID=445932 RepID=B2KCI0_ELUMP|nr:S1 RNA-binding domain-containing protein [Elusimicrobium minutum]ACC98101.1 Ribosomal protein S1 [Elusimicrobium minutum Pei191]